MKRAKQARRGEKKKVRAFERVAPGWIPLHLAMMRFFPEYSTGRTFKSDIEQLVATLTESTDYTVAETDTYTVEIGCGGASLFIDAGAGEMQYAEPEDLNIWTPFSIFRDTLSSQAPQAKVKRLADLALKIAAFLEIGFRRAVNNGSAELFGRWRHLQAPFEPIFPDQWERLSQVNEGDWSPQTDMGTDDITIYAIQVNPRQRQRPSSNRAAQACEAYFVSRMTEAVLKGQRVIRNTLINDACAKWLPDVLSGREILRRFEAAKTSTKSNSLIWRGRSKKN